MTDNELIELFVPIIQAGLTANGFTTSVVVASPQPLQQGIPDVPTVFFKKTGDHPYGWVGNTEEQDEFGNQLQITTQSCETSFRIECRVQQNPSDLTIPTASDLANFVALLMNAQGTLETLAASDVGILRITGLSNQYYTDDRNQQEAFPGFDFTLTHVNTIATIVPVIQSIKPGIYPV